MNIKGSFLVALLASTYVLGAAPAESEDSCNNYAKGYQGIGFDIGVGYSGFTYKSVYTNPLNNANITRKFCGAPGFAVQANLSGTYGFAKYWTAGLNVYGQFNTAVYHDYMTASIYSTQTHAHLLWNIGVDARFGLVYSPENTLFLYVGPDWAYYHFYHAYARNTSPDHQHGFFIAPRAGFGAAQKVASHWVLQETFDYAWYNKKTINHPNGAAHTVTFDMATFLFSVEYLF